MSLRCLFNMHRPMLNSIVRKADRFTALCDDCGLPLERMNDAGWAKSEPLARIVSEPS